MKPNNPASATASEALASSTSPSGRHPLQVSLVALCTAALLGGCLVEGDLNSAKTREELIAQLEAGGAGGQGGNGGGTSNRETGGSGSSGGTGGSGTGGSGGSGSGAPSTGALTNPNVQADHYPGTQNYSKEVDLPSCDGADALRISTPAGLAQINTSGHRVYCIAPGDYRSFGTLAISAAGGTAEEPKVVRFESSEFDDSDEIFTADISKLARMPMLDIRNTSHWVFNRLAWEGTSGMPIRMAGATDIVIDRIRLTNNWRGIEFQHGTNDSYLQNSYIGNQIIPQGSGNDGVCVAFIGHYRQASFGGNIDYNFPVVARGNHIVNNEIFNCNDGIQTVWMPQYSNEPNFQGTVMAGNDIYIDDRVYTNCYGSKDSSGPCAFTENAIDLKGGSLDASDPMLIFDNRMWGWRDTDSNYNSPANSHGTAISTHFNPVQNVEIYENVFWDIPSAVSFTRGSKDSIIRDNVIKNVTGESHNSGIGVVIYSDPYDYDSPGDYGNVTGMTVEKNHIINTDAPWLSMSATNSTVRCNVVANGGSWTALSGPWATGATVGQNTFYNTNSGGLSASSDTVLPSFAGANMGELCFKVKQASVPGGEQVCLADVLDTPASPNTCASDYWTAERW